MNDDMNPLLQSPFLRKPLWVIRMQENEEHHAGSSNSSLKRHLTLFDLVSVGVGGTIGSGIFVLCGMIAHDHAGPATFLSWGIAGVAATLSGCCFAEMAGRIPSAGSSYVYTYCSMGELPAVLAAAFLTLEYLFSGSAVARSWGDKVVEWLQMESGDEENWASRSIPFMEPGYQINPMACLVSAASTWLLYHGVRESKNVTNFFSVVKVGLVLFMVIGGFILVDRDNWKPMIPPEYGMAGVFRGATSSFFGYIGYDEVCCIAGEAINPQVNMPRAVMLVIALVTVLYMAAGLALTGMQPFEEISSTSGFPYAFNANGISWASHVAAAGEVFTLPVVVLITLMAQPRLQYALAQDGLLPPAFGEVDQQGNLKKGTLWSGILMTVVATFVPFAYLNDLISAGILVAFTMTDCSVLIMRRESPEMTPHLLEHLLLAFNALCFVWSFLITHYWHVYLMSEVVSVLGVIMIGLVATIAFRCPERATFGGGITSSSADVVFFQTPFVPVLPCMAIFVNWYLVAQLEPLGLILLLFYTGCAVALYYSYGAKHSVGNTRGWGTTTYHQVHEQNENNEQNMLRTISLPRRVSG